MVQDFTPPRPTDRSMRPYVRSVNHIKPDQLGNVNIAEGTPADGDTYIYNSVTNLFEYGQATGPSWIDTFTVTDDATDTFILTFAPVFDSWNVSMGWPFGEDRYSITGRTLTVLDPADTFRGVADNGPRNLRVQYDYGNTSSTPPAEVSVPFESTGWKYLQVSLGDSTDRSGVAFDDSGWSTGQGGFGEDTSTGFSFVFPVATAWDNTSRLWLRRSVPEGANYEVSVRVDDSCVLYWNGTQFATAAGASTTEAVASAGPFTVPSGLVTSGDQVFAARFEDGAVGPGGGIALADVKISGDLA